MNFQEQLKAANVAKGKRAITRVKLPVVNTPGPWLGDQPELAEQRAKDGVPERVSLTVGLRAATPGEFETVLERTLKYVLEKGMTAADPRSDMYSIRFNLNLLAITCVDPDADADDPRPFWGERGDIDGAIETMRTSDHLTRDSILYLAQHQEAWQDQVSPSALRLSSEQLWILMKEVAASTDISPFLELRVGMQWQLVRFLVSLLSTAQTDNSPTPSGSSETRSES